MSDMVSENSTEEAAPAVLESRPAADDMPELDPRIEAHAFRRLVEHLRQREDVQNVDLMGWAGFCRNCLAEWLEEGALKNGVPMTDNEAKKHIYGMPYAEWKAHQKDATPEQLQRMEASKARNREVRGEPSVEKQLDREVEGTFPASDPLQLTRPEAGGAAA